MTLMRAALRLLRRIPDSDARADRRPRRIRDTSAQQTADPAALAGHRENIGAGLIASDVAAELEDELRDALTAQPPATSRPRTASPASRTSWPRPTTARPRCRPGRGRPGHAVPPRRLHRRDTRPGARRRSRRGDEGLPWEGLAGWFGEDVLMRRIAEMLAAVADEQRRSPRRNTPRCPSPPIMRPATARGHRGNAWPRLTRRTPTRLTPTADPTMRTATRLMNSSRPGRPRTGLSGGPDITCPSGDSCGTCVAGRMSRASRSIERWPSSVSARSAGRRSPRCASTPGSARPAAGWRGTASTPGCRCPGRRDRGPRRR